MALLSSTELGAERLHAAVICIADVHLMPGHVKDTQPREDDIRNPEETCEQHSLWQRRKNAEDERNSGGVRAADEVTFTARSIVDNGIA